MSLVLFWFGSVVGSSSTHHDFAKANYHNIPASQQTRSNQTQNQQNGNIIFMTFLSFTCSKPIIETEKAVKYV